MTTTVINGTLKTQDIQDTDETTGMSIATVSRTSSINIGTGGINGVAGTTQGINIGSGTNNAYSFMSLGSDTLAANYIRSANIQMNTNNSGETNIGWVNGAVNGTTNVYGNLKTKLIEPLTGTTDLDLGKTQTSGIINIGLADTRSGFINIGNNMTAGTIQLGTNFSGGGTAAVSIGTSGKNTFVNGTLKSNTIESTTTANTLNIATTARTVPINIGTGGISGTAGSTQGINIGSGTNNIHSFMSLGSDTLGYSYIRATNIEMNTNNSGNTNIGWRNTGAGTYGFTNIFGGLTSLGETIKNTIVGIGGNVDVTYGNKTAAGTGMSTTFCRKSTTTMTGQNCFTITMDKNYSSAVFDLMVGGSNEGGGGYSYKGSFTITGGGSGGATPSVSAFTTYLIGGTGISASTSVSGKSVTLTIGNPSGTLQTFCATLIMYASTDINNNGTTFTVTAI